MSWYVAKSLDKLLAQLNARFPNRSKVSDGSIGDAAHSARESDHNPTAAGQVCARDFTNDPAPATGLHGQWLADALVASRDQRIKYVIFNHRIIDSRAGQHPWQWMPYNGQNAHEHHVHVSVFAGALGDDTQPWNLGGADQEDDMQLTDKVRLFDGTTPELQQVLAGILTRLADPVIESVRFPGHKDTLANFVRAIDNNVLGLGDQLKRIADGQAETNAKLGKLIELLTPKGGA